MKVFKTCFLITLQNKATIIIYLTIFSLLSIIMGNSNTSQNEDFTASKPAFSIINRDKNSVYIEGFTEYLSAKGRLVTLKDSTELLQDSLFYGETDFILIIPEGFQDSLFGSAPLKLQTVSSQNTAAGYYLTSLVNQYWDLIPKYHTLFPELSEEQCSERVLTDLSKSGNVRKLTFGSVNTLPSSYTSYGYIVSYILMTMIMLCISNIFLAFQKPDIIMRNLCSPLPPSRLHRNLSVFGILLSLLCWVLLTLTGHLYHTPLTHGVDIRLVLLFHLNTLIYTFVAFGASMFFLAFINTPNAQSILCNFISLVFSFLGGIFVPLELLDENLLKLSRFTPTYWYTMTLQKLNELTDFTFASLKDLLTCMTLELTFAFAFLAVSLVVYQCQSRARKSYGTVKTDFY